MKGKFNKTSALAIIDNAPKQNGRDVRRLQASIAKEFALIPQREMTNAVSAILIGLGLHIIKASVPRGEFRPYIEETLPSGNKWTKGTAIKNASLFMRLSLSALEQVQPSKPELLALTEGSVSSELSSGAAAKYVSRLEEWIGERSLNELLIDEGIKHGGGAGSGKVIELPPAATGTDPLLADLSAHYVGLREVLLKPENLKRLTARQIEDTERELASFLEEFRQLKAKLNT